MTDSNKLLTVTEVAGILGVTRQTIHNWIGDGRFPNKMDVGGGKLVLIPASDVDAVKRQEADKLIAGLRRLGFR
ncbi:MAG: helix-turn-helix domain-containing protein [Anaerolineae bacterium]|nr:helix-turn-helix domain-containing protein [Anaerolineae bacterium]